MESKQKMYDKKLIDKKIKELRKKYPGSEISIGMRKDWFWTAESVDNQKEWDVIQGKYYRIAGIPGSYIDTPVLSVNTEEGELIIPCYIEVDGYEAAKIWKESNKIFIKMLKEQRKNKVSKLNNK